MILFEPGDTFITHKREYYIFYKEVMLTGETFMESLLQLKEILKNENSEIFAHFSGAVPSDFIYHKIAKPQFRFKQTYYWKFENLMRLLAAKNKGNRKKVEGVTYMGRVRDINLDTLRSMCNGPGNAMSDLGNELLFASINDLNKLDIKFETI